MKLQEELEWVCVAGDTGVKNDTDSGEKSRHDRRMTTWDGELSGVEPWGHELRGVNLVWRVEGHTGWGGDSLVYREGQTYRGPERRGVGPNKGVTGKERLYYTYQWPIDRQ